MSDLSEQFRSWKPIDALFDWFSSTLTDPEDITLDALPPTFLWAPYLKHLVNTSNLYRTLLPSYAGVLLTGPEGNGKHTYADAITRSRMNHLLYNQTEGAIVSIISPDTLSPDLSADYLCAMVHDTYLIASVLLKNTHPQASYVMTFVALDRYPKSVSDQIAECVSDYEGERIFTICLAESEAKISQSLKRTLMHCRCPKPNLEQRFEWLERNLSFEVTNIWDQPKGLPRKHLQFQLEGGSMEDLAKLTEGCSYADLEELLRLFKLYTVDLGVRALTTDKPRIEVTLPKQVVLHFLDLSHPPVKSAPAGIPISPMAQTFVPVSPSASAENAMPSEKEAAASVEDMVARMELRDKGVRCTSQTTPHVKEADQL